MRRRRGRSPASAIDEARRLLTQGGNDEYLAYTERAVQEFPGDADIRVEYATALAASSPEQAREEALKATELDTGDPVRLTRLAGLLLDLGARDVARSCAERAEQVARPNDAVGRVVANRLSNIRGAIAAIDGDDALAEEALRAAHDADLSNPFFARDLATFLGSRRRFDEALQAIDETLAAPTDPATYTEQSHVMLRTLREDVQRRVKTVRSTTRLGSSGSTSSTSTRRHKEDPTP